MTIDKANKPTILTESDRIFSDLSNELSHLKDRMSQLEKEQEDSRSLIDQISFQEQLASKLVYNQKQEIDAQKENYQVIADVMHNLKTPVNSVMKNLASIISEIDDIETQDSLKDCMNTASNVLKDFSDVEEFCLFGSQETHDAQSEVNLKELFTQVVAQFQVSPQLGQKHSLKLSIEEEFPNQSSVYADTLRIGVQSLLEELALASSASILQLDVKLQSPEASLDNLPSNLLVTLNTDASTKLQIHENWVAFVKANSSKLKQSGFSLLKVRDQIRKVGGHLSTLEKQGNLVGFQFTLPLFE